MCCWQTYTKRIRGMDRCRMGRLLRNLQQLILRQLTSNLKRLTIKLMPNFISSLKTKAGFTLIELMVVISIIGILSAIGLTSYDASQKKARDTIRKNDLRELQKALQAYYQDNEAYPIQSGWASSEPGDYSPYSANYIPGLAPKYIA